MRFPVAIAVFGAAGAFFAPAAGRPFAGAFVTIVVPAEVLLASELLPVSISLPAAAAGPRFV